MIDQRTKPNLLESNLLSNIPLFRKAYKRGERVNTYLLLTEFEGRTVSYGPSFFLLDLWPKREARGP